MITLIFCTVNQGYLYQCFVIVDKNLMLHVVLTEGYSVFTGRVVI